MLCNSLCRIRKVRRNLKLVRLYSNETEVIVPKRIHRGPTDILEALASTINRDPTAAHYKYHDDPYLIPTSNFTKRIYALSQESGKKTAMWIRQQHPQLFMHREAVPPIESYFPRATYDEDDEVDNEVLSEVIGNAFVTDAITVYELMQKKGIEVSGECKQSLLELLCFFNESDEVDPELIEEKWFTVAAKSAKNAIKKTWKDGKYAEKLFNEMPPTAASYSALIQGMGKYYQVDRAYELYKEAQEKGFILSTNTFNYLIRDSIFIKEGFPKRWELISELLSVMNKQGVEPNVGTLNAVLEALTMTSSNKECRTYALRTIAEMRQLGIEPSLASFTYLLMLFCDERVGPAVNIIEPILDYLENNGGKLKIHDRNDVTFFTTAMEKCRYVFRNQDIVYRINNLLNTGRNYNFIGDSYKESIYYRHYFVTLCQTETIEGIMENYNLLVPNVYVPEAFVIEELIKVATMNGANNLFAQFWSDIVMFDMYDNERLVKAVLSGMLLNRPLQWSATPSETAVSFGNVAWSIYQKLLEDLPYNKNQFTWTGSMLGDIMVLCLYANDLEKAGAVLKKLKNEQNKIIGIPPIENFNTLIDVCIENRDRKSALLCIEYCTENGYGEVEEMSRKLIGSIELDAHEKSKIAALVGSHVLKSNLDESQKIAN